MGRSFNFGLSGLIWVVQVIVLGILVICCITAPVISRLGFSKYQDVTYGVFGYCSRDGKECSSASANYHAERLSDNGDWRFGNGLRSKLSPILLVAPIAAGFTLLAILSNFTSQFRVVNRHAGIFVSNLLWTGLAFLSSALLCVVVWLLFWPHLTWCAYLLVAAAAIHLVCIPLTYLAHSQVSQDYDDEDVSGLNGGVSRHKYLEQEEDFSNAFNVNEFQRTAADRDLPQPGYYKASQGGGSAVSGSSKTEFSGMYPVPNQTPPQSYLRSNPAVTNRRSYISNESSHSTRDPPVMAAPYPLSSSGSLAQTGSSQNVFADRVGASAVTAPYPVTSGVGVAGQQRNYQGSGGQTGPGVAAPTGNSKYYANSYNGLQPSQPYSAINNPSLVAGGSSNNLADGSRSQLSHLQRQASPVLPSAVNGPGGLRSGVSDGAFTPSSSNYDAQTASAKVRNIHHPNYVSNAGGPPGAHSKAPPVPGLPSKVDYPLQDFDDEEFVRQNTIDPEERPPVEDDDGIKDDGSDFTSVSQRGVNPGYFVGKQAPYPIQHYSAPPSQQQQYYQDPKIGPYNQPNTPISSGQPQYLSQSYPSQQQSGYYSAPLGPAQHRDPDHSDILLQNNPDFMVGGAASNKATKFGSQKSPVQGASSPNPQGLYYRPAYKKRIQKQKNMTAASMSRDSPYGGR
ncbi:Dcv1p Ecym_2720 [Eremothecium cymbalariae DBVPG|uniref:PH-response regulator protein palI/RIM9 n=1 Tax=Eremothecium cymbalariae (strain CBS 270.75 / DBVPG 7215 / KCTC 17166 / NRRL Y-17582) TaxID=931890 RepID=G8JPF7_ERECY|nr:Hypothetical protein Ecym_2720 [Eremothecium cymbalariae DBVPG\